MTDTKWTAGPWVAVCGGPDYFEGTRLVTATVFSQRPRGDMPGRGYRDDNSRVDNVEISSCATYQQDLSVDELHSNAHLIAAAPELYDALEAILNAGQWYESALEIDAHRGGEAPDGCKLEAMAMMALAKARGES